MAQVKNGPTDIQGHRSLGASGATSAATRAPHGSARAADRPCDEVESVARIGSYSTDLLAGRWVSSKGLDAIFGIDAAFDRSVEGWASLVHPADREAMVAYLIDEVVGRAQPFDRQYRIVRADTGAERWVHGRGALKLDGSGRPVRMLGTIADITEQRSAQDALVASELRYAAIFEGTAESILIAEVATGHFRWVNSAACALLGYTRGELLELTVHDIHPPADLPIDLDRFQAIADGRITMARSVPCQRKDGTILLADVRGSQAVVDGVACNIAFFSDVTELRRLEVQDRKLAQAVEQASEAILIADLTGTIEYVNPAFERVSGYRRDEAVGQNPRLLKSGLQPPSSFDAMWAALTNGVPWVGDLVNQRKDGTLFTEETVISPVHDSTGAITSYVAVQRDVTHERALEERSSHLARERALIAETIRGLHAGDTPEATAQAICRRVMSLTGVMAAQISLFELDGRAWPIGFVVEDQSDPPLRRLPEQRSRHLRERAAEGPWIEPWANRPSHPYNQLLNDLGVHALACAPVRHDQQVIGLLVIYTAGSVEEVAVTEALPALVQFADLAGALIGRDVVERTEAGRGRNHIADVIARRAFRPVFQPIVELASNEIVGYEALTRFTDGANPEVLFAEAAAVGLGAELEMATLQTALAAAEALPRSVWLNLNASPELILAGEPLRSLLAGSRRRLVLEVTEHAAIADYPAFRAAMNAFGPEVEFAVDDAGTGFASLRHIVELHPTFVKLDRSLMAGLESDDARQAMIVGLCHFAHVTGCRLIVEGIETDSELTVLRALTIELGQGYLLGRPLPVGSV